MSNLELEKLNPAQKEAVEITEGKLLILAGAGSGKTKVLTTKIGYLIEHKHVAPESILGLTFTRKAAEEMRERLGHLIDPKLAKKVMLSTFHSFCSFILRKEIHHLGYTSNFTLYDKQDVVRLASTIARDILEHEGDLPSLTRSLDVIAQAKNKALFPEQISGTESEWHDGFVKELFSRLNESMKAHNALDFDHILYLTFILFEKHPEVLAKYQERFRYVLIDEYQDTNPVQVRISEAITKKHGNLCVVGDDDQSIYGWRGADVNNILQFSYDKVIKLEQNFRSTNTILRAANSVIHCNEMRHTKSLWSDKGDGQLIEVFYAPNELQEAEAIAQRLLHLKQQHGLKWQDFAVLYRSNSLARAVETAFLKQTYQSQGQWYRGIPYKVFGGDEFYEHKEVKDLMAYLRVVANDHDQEAIIRVINYPRRGIGESALGALTSYQRSHTVSLWHVLEVVAGIREPDTEDLKKLTEEISERAVGGIRNFVHLIRDCKEKLQSVPCSKILTDIIERISFYKSIHEEVKSEAMRKWKGENIQGLVKSVEDYCESETLQEREPMSHSERLCEFISTMLVDGDSGSWKKKERHSKDHVHLMTFHSAKGLEFNSCFLVGLEDHLIPHERSVTDGNIEEERRLMYVAMTRAKKILTLSMSTSRPRMGELTPSKPSRFLFEIPKEYMQITKWNRVGVPIEETN